MKLSLEKTVKRIRKAFQDMSKGKEIRNSHLVKEIAIVSELLEC
jgi:hypothetical protein